MGKSKSHKVAENNKYGNGNWAKNLAQTIELTFESFGITTRVTDINNFDDYIEFRLEVALGTSLENITKLHKDIAMSVASTSGDVEIEAPIPGTSLIAIRVPDKNSHIRQTYNPPAKKFELDKIGGQKTESKSVTASWREFLSDIFYVIAYSFVRIAELFHKR